MLRPELFRSFALILGLTAAACGGRVGSVDDPSGTPGSPSPAPSSPSGPEASPSPSAPRTSPADPSATPANRPISVDPNASNGEPRIVETPSAPANVAVPFHLVVSNQSFVVSTADIDVTIDGQRVVTGDFEVGSQHTYRTFDFALPVGSHQVEAVSKRGGVAFSGRLDLNGERWGVLMFWQDGGRASEFSLQTMESAPGFD